MIWTHAQKHETEGRAKPSVGEQTRNKDRRSSRRAGETRPSTSTRRVLTSPSGGVGRDEHIV
ncbi:MAG: hypothetical protein D6723_15040 [Acidobacteria bacterium]|nr:MAG: hypothetical protein D6723_15040 [Acidobacteriota bacterium]